MNRLSSGSPISGTRWAHDRGTLGTACSIMRRTRASMTRAGSRAPASGRDATANRNTFPPSSPAASASRSDRHNQVRAASLSAASASSSSSASFSACSKRTTWARRARSYQMEPSTPKWSALASSRRSVSVADRTAPSRCITSASTATGSRCGTCSSLAPTKPPLVPVPDVRGQADEPAPARVPDGSLPARQLLAGNRSRSRRSSPPSPATSPHTALAGRRAHRPARGQFPQSCPGRHGELSHTPDRSVRKDRFLAPQTAASTPVLPRLGIPSRQPADHDLRPADGLDAEHVPVRQPLPHVARSDLPTVLARNDQVAARWPPRPRRSLTSGPDRTRP